MKTSAIAPGLFAAGIVAWALLTTACEKKAASLLDKARYDRVVFESRKPDSPVSNQELLDNLRSPDKSLVLESLGALTFRNAHEDQDFVVTLLADPEPFVWLNAAHYLGMNGRKESIPYLIKTLHVDGYAKLSRPVAVARLHEMTGQDFPDDFGKWKTWYDSAHPGSPMDWESNLTSHLK